MAVRLIPNQLVKLYDTETFNERNKRLMLDYRTYCQIVREEQTTMFQLQILPDTENLITNGDFVNDISGWNVVNQTWQFASGRLQGLRDTNANPDINQQVSTIVGKTYKLKLTVQFVSLASKLTVVANQGGLISWVYQASDYGTQPFDIEVFFIADLAHVDITFILSGNLRDLVYIDDVELYSLSEPTVTLETCEGDFVKTIPVFARANDIVNYSIDWYGLDEDCYRICITGVDDTENNFLDNALALATEGGDAIELEQGGFLKWYG